MKRYRSTGMNKQNLEVWKIFFFSFLPHSQPFELNPLQKSMQFEIMKNKRVAHGEIIERFEKKSNEIERESELNFLSTSEQQLPKPSDQQCKECKSSLDQVIMSDV